MVNLMNLKDYKPIKNHLKPAETPNPHVSELKKDISMPEFNLETNMDKLKEKLSVHKRQKSLLVKKKKSTSHRGSLRSSFEEEKSL